MALLYILGLGGTMYSKQNYTPMDNIPAPHEFKGPEVLKTLISNMLDRNPATRPTIGEVQTGMCIIVTSKIMYNWPLLNLGIIHYFMVNFQLEERIQILGIPVPHELLLLFLMIKNISCDPEAMNWSWKSSVWPIFVVSAEIHKYFKEKLACL